VITAVTLINKDLREVDVILTEEYQQDHRDDPKQHVPKLAQSPRSPSHLDQPLPSCGDRFKHRVRVVSDILDTGKRVEPGKDGADGHGAQGGESELKCGSIGVGTSGRIIRRGKAMDRRWMINEIGIDYKLEESS